MVNIYRRTGRRNVIFGLNENTGKTPPFSQFFFRNLGLRPNSQRTRLIIFPLACF